MARKPRIHYTGAFYHVMLRGNGGKDIFHDEKDGQEFRALIADGLDRFGYNIHAYCFMPNHIHMVIEVADVPLSKIMQNLSFRYTVYMNKKLGVVGHLFQGRYKALLMDSDSYLLTVVRYIHNNPVEARLAKSPADWLWSSDRSYRNKTAGSIVHTDKLLSMISSNIDDRTKAYESYMASKSKAVWPPNGVRGEIIGDEKFIAKFVSSESNEQQYIKLSPKRLYELAKQELGISKAELLSRARGRELSHTRAVFARAVHELCGYSIADIAMSLGRDGSSLGRLIQNIDDNDKNYIAFKEAILG